MSAYNLNELLLHCFTLEKIDLNNNVSVKYKEMLAAHTPLSFEVKLLDNNRKIF